MTVPDLPTPELLRQLLRYEPDTGKLYWRSRPVSFFKDRYRSAEGCAANWNSRWAGKEAFTARMRHGHLQGRVEYRAYLAHRVAWAIHYGEWPKGEIDHINHDAGDNRIANLRDVTHAQNMQNQSFRRNNSSGITGVIRMGDKWVARLRHGGRFLYLGRFACVEDAVAARKAAEVRLGFHANHGA